MGTLEIFPAMKNKFNETDTICEKAYWILPKPLKEFSEIEVSPNKRDYDTRKIIWKNPIIIKEDAWFYLILWLHDKALKVGKEKITRNQTSKVISEGVSRQLLGVFKPLLGGFEEEFICVQGTGLTPGHYCFF